MKIIIIFEIGIFFSKLGKLKEIKSKEKFNILNHVDILLNFKR